MELITLLIATGVPGFLVYSILYKKVIISEHTYNKSNRVYLISFFTIIVFSLTLIISSLILSLLTLLPTPSFIDNEYFNLGIEILTFSVVSLIIALILGFLIFPFIINKVNRINFNNYLYQDTKSALTEAITLYNYDEYAPYVYVVDFQNSVIIDGAVKYIGNDDILQFYGPQREEKTKFNEVFKVYNEYQEFDFNRAQVVLDNQNKLQYYVIHQDIEN